MNHLFVGSISQNISGPAVGRFACPAAGGSGAAGPAGARGAPKAR